MNIEKAKIEKEGSDEAKGRFEVQLTLLADPINILHKQYTNCALPGAANPTLSSSKQVLRSTSKI